MQDNWWSNKADELQDLADRHDSRFNDGMMGRVCADGKKSDGFEVAAGVKQGCVIAPSLFGLLFAAMLKEATEDMPQGVTIRFRNGSIFNLSRPRASTKVTALGPHQRTAIC